MAGRLNVAGRRLPRTVQAVVLLAAVGPAVAVAVILRGSVAVTVPSRIGRSVFVVASLHAEALPLGGFAVVPLAMVVALLDVIRPS